MFALLPVDMINGILLKNNLILPISIGQFYKLLILFTLFFRFLLTLRLLIASFLITLCLLLPSLFQLLTESSDSFLFADLVKISKYLTPFFCFLFFVEFIKKKDESAHLKLIKLIRFSYMILVVNIFVKYIGLGYPAYEHGDIGSKGFFFAGNEISALLIILSSILAFTIWEKGNKKQYYLFLALNLLAGLTISSKTAILGIILIFFAIPFQKRSFKINKLLLLVTSSIVFLPILFLLSWKFIQNSALILRIQYFYEKLDLWTFILSSRNIYLKNAFENYLYEYNTVEKIIGVGKTKYELLNDFKVVEMDVVDIFFTYGFLGLFIFIIIITFLLVQARRFSMKSEYLYGSFIFLMVIILLIISTLAGHVFGSGMSAVFIGLLFSLMYLKKDV